MTLFFSYFNHICNQLSIINAVIAFDKMVTAGNCDLRWCWDLDQKKVIQVMHQKLRLKKIISLKNLCNLSFNGYQLTWCYTFKGFSRALSYWNNIFIWSRVKFLRVDRDFVQETYEFYWLFFDLLGMAELWAVTPLIMVVCFTPDLIAKLVSLIKDRKTPVTWSTAFVSWRHE